MSEVLAICGALLAVAAVPVLWRLTRGPSTLDRAVAVDMLTSVLIGAVAIMAALTRRADLMPLLVVLAVVGFVGSTALARFAKAPKAEEKRVLTKAEVAAADAEFLAHNADDDAPVHDIDAGDLLGLPSEAVPALEDGEPDVVVSEQGKVPAGRVQKELSQAEPGETGRSGTEADR
ncbi:multicomponent Na+:H+ antiporter subunit F [Arcanobacterium wilhelmae]|uniref:Multicomponent Na+:H+ antiporter subunit F n=1 Tax=Arcanobacterium wilhelmae TaxID=1803177 RepID=A0ABT9NAH7_9ACTO|nr:monovalent cation/H+ antiporter complex subunit F [Arcanobacterium wilhelmae]MDP9800727.1 multicomponent Na+:H+ antiporter subunit F [Arcanobacterium wilhelmae]WFN90126.1 monovalent cation/H+ antiporter complex subunit F [Arcanobacterium wilhelmae]